MPNKIAKYDAEGHPIVDDLDQVDQYLNQRKEDMESGKLFEENGGTITVDHVATANCLIKFINTIPKLDPWIKKILIMRLSRPLINGKPMSYLAIALELGMSEQDVKDLEIAGKKIANEWMARNTIEDGARSNESNSSINDILNQTANIKMK